MKIIKKKGTPAWVGKVLQCQCGCSFELEADDKDKFIHYAADSMSCGGGHSKIKCPECNLEIFA